MAPAASQTHIETSSIVIIGLGMVGLSFIEKILEYDTSKKYTITAICEEPLGKQIVLWYPSKVSESAPQGT
jgi:hypothetical protein